MKYDLDSFGKRLKKLIEKRYETQAEIARRAQIDKNNLSLYCNGKKPLSKKTLIKLCVTLDCSPQWLLEAKGSLEDKFNFAQLAPPPQIGKLVAQRINELVEIRFIVPQKDFATFFFESQRDGCLT